MKKLASLIFLATIISGCTSFAPTIPDGYVGPKAVIQDTAKRIDSGKADLFYLSHIDGKAIRNSRSASLNASYGQGNYLSIITLDNSVPAEQHVFTIIGRTEYAMPIRALAGTVFEVKGDVEFSPSPNEAYVIKGMLSEEGSKVWIEKISDGEVIKKIEIEGPAKLGFFEK